MEAKKIMADSYFDTCLQQSIETYTKRKPAASGRRYIRTPWDSLFEKGILTIQGLRDEFNKIIEKKSTLSSAERDVVSKIVFAALRRASVRMQVQEQNKAAAERENLPQDDEKGRGRAVARGKERKRDRDEISKK